MSEVEFSDANFQSEVIDQKGKPVLVDFWAEWCGPCKMQGPIVEEVANEIGDKAKVGKLEVDLNPATAQQFQILSIPTLAIFKDGKMVWQAVGLQQKQNILKELQSHI